MKIIKRNGSEVPFDITKIITAVTKASDSVSRKSSLTQEQILSIANDVTEQCQALNRAVSVEEIQDMVENKLMDIQAHDVARHYITYRYVQSLKRQTNTTDERILSLIECQNEEVKQENANKNPTVNSVQRAAARDALSSPPSSQSVHFDTSRDLGSTNRIRSSSPFSSKPFVSSSCTRLVCVVPTILMHGCSICTGTVLPTLVTSRAPPLHAVSSCSMSCPLV